MGPLDYTIQVIDPIQAALQQRGLRFAEEQQVRSADQQDVALGQGQQRLDMAQQQMQIEQAEAQRQRAAQEAAAMEQQRGQDAFVRLMFDTDLTADDVMGAVQSNPSMAQPIMEYWQGRNEEQAASDLAFGKQVAFALGNAPDQAAALMEKRAEAAANAGDQASADTMKAQAELIRSGSDGIAAMKAQTLMALAGKLKPEELQSFMDAAGLSQAAAKPQSAAGKIEADFKAGLISQEARDMQLSALGPTGTTIETTPGGGSRIVMGASVGGADAKAQMAAEKEANRASLMTEDIQRAKSLIQKDPIWTSGLVGNWLKDWAGTKAADTKALLDTVRANIGFKELSEMRQSSPTGAALGSVTERELALLQAVVGSLEQSQSPEQLLQNLQRLETALSDVVNGTDAQFVSLMREKQAKGEAPTPQERMRIENIAAKQGRK